MEFNKICVIGGGAFGTSLAYLAARNNYQTYLYTSSQQKVENINNLHINKDVYPDKILPSNLIASMDIEECLQNSLFCILSIPVQSIPSFIQKNKQKLIEHKTSLISSSKGMLVQQKKFISEYINEELEGLKMGVISGPSFAEEIIRDDPTLVVLASEHYELAEQVQKCLSNKYFRIYTQKDVLGVEISGALKNVIAIGAGIVEGAGYGYNTKTALVCRSTREIIQFMTIYGTQGEALFGLAGIGDIMLTCYGKLSRNMSFGLKIAQGKTKEQIIQESKGVVEGVPTMKVIIEYSQSHNIRLPIIETIDKIVDGLIDVKDAGEKLMAYDLTDEFSQDNYKTRSRKSIDQQML